jgi:hypothetical protein
MIIENKYEIGQKIYLITDKEQDPRIITAIKIFSNGTLLYLTACGIVEYWAEECEISVEKNAEIMISV